MLVFYWSPGTWIHVDVHLLTGGPAERYFCGKVVGHGLENLEGCESFEASGLKWGLSDGVAKLPVPGVRSIDRLDIHQLERVQREMGRILLVRSVLVKTVLDLVRVSWGIFNDVPGAGDWNHQLVDLAN